MIRFRQVTKTYSRTHTHALRDVNFHVQKGEFVYITGHSGAGKSTLLGLTLRRTLPSEGSVEILGQETSRIRESRLPHLRRKIGMVFQDHRLLPNMSAINNITFALRAVGERGNLDQRAMGALRQVTLAHKRKAYPVELSLGEQQRVAIARAIAKRPEILLCDEPTGALDRATGVTVLEALVAVNRDLGTATALITHNAAIQRIADRVIVLADGQIERITANPERVPPSAVEW